MSPHILAWEAVGLSARLSRRLSRAVSGDLSNGMSRELSGRLSSDLSGRLSRGMSLPPPLAQPNQTLLQTARRGALPEPRREAGST